MPAALHIYKKVTFSYPFSLNKLMACCLIFSLVLLAICFLQLIHVVQKPNDKIIAHA